MLPRVSRFLDPGFVDRLVGGLTADEAFGAQTRWFDGSIALHDGEAQLWMKLFRGDVAEVRPFAPPTGVTIKVSGPGWAWDALASGERRVMDLLLAGYRGPAISVADLQGEVVPRPGALVLEGDGMAALRMTEAICLILDHYARAAGAEVGR